MKLINHVIINVTKDFLHLDCADLRLQSVLMRLINYSSTSLKVIAFVNVGES